VRTRLGLLLLAALGWSAAVQGAQAPDPFYTDLLRSGTQALERGDTNRAVEELRLACFGMLDHPKELAVCLVRLALGQAKLGEKEEFLQTFRRIEEVETRFKAYGEAPIAAAERSAFEAQSLEWVPPEVLRSMPGYGPALREREIAAIRALPANRRLPALRDRIEAEPDELLWRTMAAELELEEEKPAAAAGYLAGVEATAGGGRVACLRGRALAEAGNCAAAVEDLGLCPERGRTEGMFDPDLACLVELELWAQARELLASAPVAVRDRGSVRRLVRKIPDEPKAASVAPEAERESEAPPAEEPSAIRASDPVPATETAARPEATLEAPEGLSPREEIRANEARRILRSARSASELEAASSIAQELVRAHPDLPELQLLVAEIHYRASRWAPCAAAYRAAGVSGPEDATQRFYMAVCLWESGDRDAAAAIAATGLERLPRTGFVQSYLDRFAAARP